MNQTRDAGSNPFATRFIRPGAIPYLFPRGLTPESLVDALAAQNWRGSIIGPHGSGKSSLLVALKPVLEARGRKIISQQLQGGEKQLRWQELGAAGWTSQTLVIIDGYEQLSSWQRLLLRARCRLRGAGLLVTAHQPVGLKPIFTTNPSAELTQSIVRQLVREDDRRILPADIEVQFERTKGDVRETLLALFDLYRTRS
jgi:hypothetical protein